MDDLDKWWVSIDIASIGTRGASKFATTEVGLDGLHINYSIQNSTSVTMYVYSEAGKLLDTVPSSGPGAMSSIQVAWVRFSGVRARINNPAKGDAFKKNDVIEKFAQVTLDDIHRSPVHIPELGIVIADELSRQLIPDKSLYEKLSETKNVLNHEVLDLVKNRQFSIGLSVKVSPEDYDNKCFPNTRPMYAVINNVIYQVPIYYQSSVLYSQIQIYASGIDLSVEKADELRKTGLREFCSPDTSVISERIPVDNTQIHNVLVSEKGWLFGHDLNALLDRWKQDDVDMKTYSEVMARHRLVTLEAHEKKVAELESVHRRRVEELEESLALEKRHLAFTKSDVHIDQATMKAENDLRNERLRQDTLATQASVHKWKVITDVLKIGIGVFAVIPLIVKGAMSLWSWMFGSSSSSFA